MHLVAAPDKFRGTATAAEVAAAVAAAAGRLGATVDKAPVSDGGEGFLDVFGGPNRSRIVTGPLGDPVEAAWRRDGDVAVIETARASGLELVGGADGNDPVAASTYGTGELILEAVEAGCRRVLVGLGGSATTDGGLGAVRAVEPRQRLRRARLVVACDVETRYLDAADRFSAQKGATPAQVRLLTRRLERTAQLFAESYGVDVTGLDGAGAAGGLAGGLAALGGELLPGFEVVADELDLATRFAAADLVVTGEGYLDEQSFAGKAVGGVAALCAELEVPCLAVVGDRLADVDAPVEVVSLTERFGESRARSETAALVGHVVAERVAQGGSPGRVAGRR